MRTQSAPHPAWPETVELDFGRIDAGPDDALRVVAGLAGSAQRLRLPEPFSFGEEAHRDATMVRLLATAAAAFVPVDWTLRKSLPGTIPERALCHLPPPRDDGEPGRRWREAHGTGTCTYRYGPGFVLIHDTRPRGPINRVHVEAGWVDAFRTLAGTDRPPADGLAADLVDQLAAHQLALRLDDRYAVVLPYHADRRPPPGREPGP
ncbi:DUF5825 family protein [Amycolatopsis sp. NBC_01480]|uniref:DUF5825 family protein n=1 Tax=Amycolatopsis sp. NBC_01480 TaxID=2903562 RepID=UPI002E2CC544|nr:DUF5825 family protein [Amycolatopsis sp. NBC_01480]